MVSTGPYGTWPSPIDARLAASHDGRPECVGVVGDEVWWTEPRPAEAGRRALIRRRADGTGDSVLPAPWNVRSRVIEYGGQPWAGAERAEGGPLIVFVHFADQRLYAYAPDEPGEPRPLTPVSSVGGGLRWVDPQLHLDRGEVWCVLEEFTGERPTDLRRVIAAVPLDGSAAEDRSAVRELTDDSHRFVTGPRLSPDGRRAAWLAWDHPRMPWDGTEVMLADVAEDGTFQHTWSFGGGPEESVPQIEWDADGRLLFASDRSGWWNLYRADPHRGAVALCPREQEFAGPLWKIGLSWFRPLENGLIATVHGRGTTTLGILDPATGDLADVSQAPGPNGPSRSPCTAAGSTASPRARTAPTRSSSWTPRPATPGSSARRTRTPSTPRTTRGPRTAPSPGPTAGRSTPTSTRPAIPTGRPRR